MSLRNMVEGDCGGVNPLMNVTSHFNRDKAFQEETLRKGLSPSRSIANKTSAEIRAEEFVQDFLTENRQRVGARANDGRAFHMDSLLRQMDNIQTRFPAQSNAGRETSDVWANEFLPQSTSGASYAAVRGVSESEGAQAKWADEFLAESERHLDASSTLAEQWVENFHQSDDLASEARKLVANVDPALDESEFVKFIKKIGNEEVKILEDGTVIDHSKSADAWASEFGASTSQKPQTWAEEFNSDESKPKDDLDFWAKLAKEWQDMGLTEEAGEHPWLSEFENVAPNARKDEYTFAEENIYKDHTNAFEAGKKKLLEGDIPSAVLLFEAACQQDPTNIEAWQYLGTTQAENEHDPAAIGALKKCLELDQNNLAALMALAVSYTNESMQHLACNTLKEWLKKNPKYQPLVREELTPEGSAGFSKPFAVTSIITSGQHELIKNLFIEAARLSPNNPDPDVQCGLGVLFNLSGEYDKAADCFQAALQVRPRDSLLWNRLGATLANGSHSEDAINAYREALSINPGFLRSRFNLGISCINLRAYREAAEHFLSVLNMQAAGRGLEGGRPLTSGNVWSTLRMVMTLMNRKDLYPAVDNKDLATLNREFQMDQNT